MATNPLVEQTIDRDLPALIALALKTHGLAVAASFWMYSPSSGQSQVVVISPAVDQLGTREAYRSVFAILDKETFSTKSFLSSHILLLGEADTDEARALIKRGTSRLASLGPFEDIDIFPVPEPESISKQGFLHLVPAGNQRVLVSFASLDRDGAVKNRSLPFDDIDRLLTHFSYSEADKEKLLEGLRQNRSGSILVQTNLKKLYEAGLI